MPLFYWYAFAFVLYLEKDLSVVVTKANLGYMKTPCFTPSSPLG